MMVCAQRHGLHTSDPCRFRVRTRIDASPSRVCVVADTCGERSSINLLIHPGTREGGRREGELWLSNLY